MKFEMIGIISFIIVVYQVYLSKLFSFISVVCAFTGICSVVVIASAL